MSNAQKDYLKKWAIGIGFVLALALLFTALVAGGVWAIIGLVFVGLLACSCIGILLATAIASLIWHWRLMGVCENEWEELMLKKWWRYMNYWGGCWEDLIPRMIEEDTDEELGIERKQQMELFERFKAVKVPRVLQW